MLEWMVFQVQEWPFVLFFYSKKGNFLAEGDIAHTVLQSDIKKTIDPPDIRVRGSRIYYVFNGK